MSWDGNDFVGRWAKLYANQTPYEAALEPAVASLGVPYRFQHPLWGLRLFPDFVLLEQRLVIEVDGDEHRTAAGLRKDAERTAKLNAADWRVVRCTNEEAARDPYGTVDRMMEGAGLALRTRRPENGTDRGTAPDPVRGPERGAPGPEVRGAPDRKHGGRRRGGGGGGPARRRRR